VFNLQGGELLIILVLALVVLGPEKLPEAMRRVGRAYAELRRMGSGFTREFRDAIEEPANDVRRVMTETSEAVDAALRPADPVPPSEAATAPTTEPPAGEPGSEPGVGDERSRSAP
jgi:sec-independent protein translocase protein TatB